jgi:NADH-quinone oxidoreductase subunit M
MDVQTCLLNFILLTVGVFFVGLYPQPIINVLRVTIGHLLLQSMPPDLAMTISNKELFV